jgi:glycosyltransferase involved in cell wall biosynthesis
LYPKFTLVANAEHPAKFGHLLNSLVSQGYADLEVIVVDQNPDDRLTAYINAAQSGLKIKHLKAPKNGASRARNVGLQHVSGEILALPDDDCWYTPGLLRYIDHWFEANPNYDILSVGANDAEGLASGNRWLQSACDIKPLNSMRTTFCNSLFFRRSSLPSGIEFDESFFPGEETDLVLRLMRARLKGRFDRTWHVGHPRRDMLSGSVSPERAVLYGRALGQLLRKHSFFGIWCALLTYDLLRAAVVAVTGRFRAAWLCLAHARGVFMGILVKPKEA